MKTEVSASSYKGQCSKCGKVWESQLLIKRIKGVGVMPPPIIRVACQCRIPVTELELVYQGAIERSKNGGKFCEGIPQSRPG